MDVGVCTEGLKRGCRHARKTLPLGLQAQGAGNANERLHCSTGTHRSDKAEAIGYYDTFLSQKRKSAHTVGWLRWSLNCCSGGGGA